MEKEKEKKENIFWSYWHFPTEILASTGKFPKLPMVIYLDSDALTQSIQTSSGELWDPDKMAMKL